MAIIIKEKKNDFERVEPGCYRAVCCDVVDIGVQKTNFGDKEMIRIHWLLDEKMTTGKYAEKPFGAVRRYSKTLSKNSKLREHLKSWRGRDFTDEELAGFDIENIIGKCCQLNIVAGHNDPITERYVDGVMADVKGADPLKIPEDYMRVCDRPEGVDSYGNSKDSATPQSVVVPKVKDEDLDDVPF